MIDIQNKTLCKKRSGWLLLWSIFLVSLLFLFFDSPVEGHSFIEKASPEAESKLEKPPEEIDIWFADQISIHAGSFTITNEKGMEMDTATPYKNQGNRRQITIPMKDKLPPGEYTVDIEVIGSDGHPLRETFHFEVDSLETLEEESIKIFL